MTSPFDQLHAALGVPPSTETVQRLLHTLDEQPEDQWAALAKAAFEWAAAQDDYALAYHALQCEHPSEADLADRLMDTTQRGQTQAALALAERGAIWFMGFQHALTSEQWPTAMAFLDRLDDLRISTSGSLTLFSGKSRAPAVLGQRLIDRFAKEAAADGPTTDTWRREMIEFLSGCDGPHADMWMRRMLTCGCGACWIT
jgi:hypothetical protein